MSQVDSLSEQVTVLCGMTEKQVCICVYVYILCASFVCTCMHVYLCACCTYRMRTNFQGTYISLFSWLYNHLQKFQWSVSMDNSLHQYLLLHHC